MSIPTRFAPGAFADQVGKSVPAFEGEVEVGTATILDKDGLCEVRRFTGDVYLFTLSQDARWPMPPNEETDKSEP